jgi:hypothetical protein
LGLWVRPQTVKIFTEVERRIQDMSSREGHGRIMSWDIDDQALKQILNWIIYYVSQDIVIEHEEY